MNRRLSFSLSIIPLILAGCVPGKGNGNPCLVHWNTYNSFKEMINAEEIFEKRENKTTQDFKPLAFDIDVSSDFTATYLIRGVCCCGSESAKKHDENGNCLYFGNHRRLFNEYSKDGEYITVAFKNFSNIGKNFFDNLSWERTGASQLARHGSEIYVLQNESNDVLVGLLFDSKSFREEYLEYFCDKIQEAIAKIDVQNNL